MTGAEARAALRAFEGVGDVEPWIGGAAPAGSAGRLVHGGRAAGPALPG
jgi:hypothetical protein